MPWSVVAAFAGVVVTALLGALAIVREQSVMRQLERVTAVLSEVPEDAAGRAHLEWLRDDLARRLNYQYRAPRKRMDLFMGWFGVLFAVGNLLAIYGIIAWSVSKLVSTAVDPAWGFWAAVGALVIVCVGLGRSAQRRLVRRARSRTRWILKARPEKSRSPFI